MKDWKFWLFWGPLFAAVFVGWWYCGGLEAALGVGNNKFEALGSLFTGLAFVGMLCTLHMQRQELKLQWQELRDTRIALEGTRDATVQSVKIEEKKHRIQQIEKLLSVKTEELKSKGVNLYGFSSGIALFDSVIAEAKARIDSRNPEVRKLLKEIGDLEVERLALLNYIELDEKLEQRSLPDCNSKSYPPSS